jgi:hypothetical protein
LTPRTRAAQWSSSAAGPSTRTTSSATPATGSPEPSFGSPGLLDGLDGVAALDLRDFPEAMADADAAMGEANLAPAEALALHQRMAELEQRNAELVAALRDAAALQNARGGHLNAPGAGPLAAPLAAPLGAPAGHPPDWVPAGMAGPAMGAPAPAMAAPGPAVPRPAAGDALAQVAAYRAGLRGPGAAAVPPAMPAPQASGGAGPSRSIPTAPPKPELDADSAAASKLQCERDAPRGVNAVADYMRLHFAHKSHELCWLLLDNYLQNEVRDRGGPGPRAPAPQGAQHEARGHRGGVHDCLSQPDDEPA